MHVFPMHNRSRRRAKAALALALCTLMLARDGLLACSPAGHTFVAAAAIGKLAQSKDPHAQRLARILKKYRWVA